MARFYGGFTYVHRKIFIPDKQRNVFYRNPVGFCIFQWLWNMANRFESHGSMGGQKVLVRRGDVLTSYNELADQWGFTLQTVRTHVKKLIDFECLALVSNRGGLLLTVLNFDEYQAPNDVGNREEKPDGKDWPDGQQGVSRKIEKINMQSNRASNRASNRPKSITTSENKKENNRHPKSANRPSNMASNRQINIALTGQQHHIGKRDKGINENNSPLTGGNAREARSPAPEVVDSPAEVVEWSEPPEASPFDPAPGNPAAIIQGLASNFGIRDRKRPAKPKPPAETSAPESQKAPSERAKVEGKAETPEAPPKRSEGPKKPPAKSTPVWDAYRTAWILRHGDRAPLRTKDANRILCRIVDELGTDGAVAIVQKYCANPNPFYADRLHPLELLERDFSQIAADGEARTGRCARTITEAPNPIPELINRAASRLAEGIFKAFSRLPPDAAIAAAHALHPIARAVCDDFGEEALGINFYDRRGYDGQLINKRPHPAALAELRKLAVNHLKLATMGVKPTDLPMVLDIPPAPEALGAGDLA